MLTDKELLEMQKVAMKAYPFPDDYGKVFKFDEERYNEILESNKQLFIDAINHLPDLIEEIMKYRELLGAIDELEPEYEEIENEADEMTIYEGDVYITNNYHMIDPEQYMQYKKQLRKEWEQNMKDMFSYDPTKTNE